MEYFTMEELLYSETALKKKIRNRTTVETEHNLAELVENLLDPVRKEYGKPVTVTSGFRCYELNKAVGGSPTSDHCSGRAADISVGSKKHNRELAKLIAENFEFDQLIKENDYEWVHVSWRGKDNRNQILATKGNGYVKIGKEQM